MAKDSNKGFERESNRQISQQKPRGNNYLLVIGIDKYKHFSKLNNAVRDAKTISDILLKKYQFKREHIWELFDEDATRKNILEILLELEDKITEKDNFILYYSGHGTIKNIRGFWIPVDAQTLADYIPHSRIKEILEGMRAYHLYLIIDSCFSGSIAFRSNIPEKRLESISSRRVFTSGMNEIVSDGRQGEHSPFAKSLINRLRANNDPLYASKLETFVLEDTIKSANQTPLRSFISGHEGGEFVFWPHTETEDWHLTKTEDTINAYSKHLRSYPQGYYYEDAHWNIACLKNEPSEYKNYLNKFPKGRFTKEASKRIANLEEKIEDQSWEKALQNHTIDAYQKYLQDYPEGCYRHQAIEKLGKIEDQSWEKALQNHTVDAYQKYLEDYSEGKYISEAKMKIKGLIYLKLNITISGLNEPLSRNEVELIRSNRRDINYSITENNKDYILSFEIEKNFQNLFLRIDKNGYKKIEQNFTKASFGQSCNKLIDAEQSVIKKLSNYISIKTVLALLLAIMIPYYFLITKPKSERKRIEKATLEIKSKIKSLDSSYNSLGILVEKVRNLEVACKSLSEDRALRENLKPYQVITARYKNLLEVKIDSTLSIASKDSILHEMNTEYSEIQGNINEIKRSIWDNKSYEACNAIQEKKRAEQELKKAKENFKSLIESYTIKIEDLDLMLDFSEVNVNAFWIYDKYDNQDRWTKAEKGKKFITSNLIISTNKKAPLLPPIHLYGLEGKTLKYHSTMRYKYYKWIDKGAYEGEYWDTTNMFKYAKEVKFSTGTLIDEKLIDEEIIFLLVEKIGCYYEMSSDKLDSGLNPGAFGTIPPIFITCNGFKNPGCMTDGCMTDQKRTLTYAEVIKDYYLVKILNKEKIL